MVKSVIDFIIWLSVFASMLYACRRKLEVGYYFTVYRISGETERDPYECNFALQPGRAGLRARFETPHHL